MQGRLHGSAMLSAVRGTNWRTPSINSDAAPYLDAIIVQIAQSQHYHLTVQFSLDVVFVFMMDCPC